MVNLTFDDSMKEILKKTIGGYFDSFSCDPFVFTHEAFEVVGLRIDEEWYRISATLKTVKRFYHDDDVSVMSFQKCAVEDIKSKMDDGILQDHPVKDRIAKIDIVNDCETVTHQKDSAVLCSTKGIIFTLESGNQIAFEIATWFSEMITIHRGYDLQNSFTKTSEFIEEWEGCAGYSAECSRTIVPIV